MGFNPLPSIFFVAVHIVGAGPSGLFLAHRLAELDVPVVVHEMRRALASKVCSGLLSAETVSRFGLKKISRYHVDGARVHAGSSTLQVFRKRVAYVFDRKDLDGYLLELAQSSGAEIRFGDRVTGVFEGITVGADGSGSIVRARCFGKSISTFPGVIAYVRGGFDRMVDVYLDGRFAPGFFAWLIPRNEETAEIGLAVHPRYASTLIARLMAFSNFLGLEIESVAGVRPVVVTRPLLTVARGNCAILGDAAGQVKASTGGGISFGLLASEVLAEAISSRDLSVYQRWHRFWLVPRLWIHYLVRRWLNAVDAEHVVGQLYSRGFGDRLSADGSMDDPAFLLSWRYLGLISQIVSPFAYIRRILP